ncbi:MAG: hypothetical protein R3357_08010 [Burkholderiales bacterium]|nr:hypothetical protein [Burkholderiales bacterium]
MLSFSESVAIFWQESDTYVAVYAAFALLTCVVISGFEFHNQTSRAPYARFLIKAVALTAATTAIFTLWLLVTGWYSRFLGGEIIAPLVIGAAWYAALYLLNASLLDAFAVSLGKPRLYAHLPVVVLIVPCFLLYAFILALGAAWTI